MDISFKAVARALDRTAPGHAAFVVADVRRLPFKPGSLARVVSPSTLDHFPDPEDLHRSLARIAGCLRPGGDLIVTLDNRQNVTDFLLRWARRLGRLPFYLGRSFTVRELERSVRRAGLRPADRTALVHHPRLMAALPARLLDRLKSPGLIRLFARVLLWMQRLERSPWQYWTGCFVAVRAVRPGGPSQEGQGRERWKRKKAPVSGA
jgi:SAM-dependent methyltransferase